MKKKNLIYQLSNKLKILARKIINLRVSSVRKLLI